MYLPTVYILDSPGGLMMIVGSGFIETDYILDLLTNCSTDIELTYISYAINLYNLFYTEGVILSCLRFKVNLSTTVFTYYSISP